MWAISWLLDVSKCSRELLSHKEPAGAAASADLSVPKTGFMVRVSCKVEEPEKLPLLQLAASGENSTRQSRLLARSLEILDR